MQQITTVGIDLAKEVFAICMLDARGAVLERKVLRRVHANGIRGRCGYPARGSLRTPGPNRFNHCALT